MQKYCIANTFLIPRTLYLSQKLLRHPYPVSSWGITFKENVIQLCHFPQKRHLRISPSLSVNNNLLTSNYITGYFVFSELDSRIIIATTCQTEQSC